MPTDEYSLRSVAGTTDRRAYYDVTAGSSSTPIPDKRDDLARARLFRPLQALCLELQCHSHIRPKPYSVAHPDRRSVRMS
jgi:hypothetical protein